MTECKIVECLHQEHCQHNADTECDEVLRCMDIVKKIDELEEALGGNFSADYRSQLFSNIKQYKKEWML